MKKLFILFLSIFMLISCNKSNEQLVNVDTNNKDIITNNNQDSIITTDFLTGSYNEEFHELNLSGKNLKQVPNFEDYLTGSYLYNVWSINLQNNLIEEVDFEKFSYFPNLTEINLSYNNLTELNNISHSFLKKLFLHKNNITKISFEGKNVLEELNLGYNALISLEGVNIPNTVKKLELQHNKLVDINGVSELTNLEVLKFEFNELDDTDMKELKNLKNLKSISYGKNNLSEEMQAGFLQFNNTKKEQN